MIPTTKHFWWTGLAGAILMLSGCGLSSQAATTPVPHTSAAALSAPPPTPTSSPASPPTKAAAPDPAYRVAGATTWLSEPQAGIAPWLSVIAQARHTLDVNDYLLTDRSLLQALRAAAHRGVRVDVIIDGRPYGDTQAVADTKAALKGSGVHLQLAPPRFEGSYAFDHAKYLVADPGTSHAMGILGSPNGTASAFDGANLEDAVETTSPPITEALAAVFQADWTGTRAGATPRRAILLSPGAQPALTTILAGHGRLAVMTEELGDAPALYQAVAAHGPRARVLVPADLSAEGQRYAQQLVQAGVQVRTLKTPYVHAKLIVTGAKTFVGSQNFSTVSLNDNREVGLVTANKAIHHQAQAWFNTAWERATPWKAAAKISTPSPDHASTQRWPYIPDGDTMAQVTALWGKPMSVTYDMYDGTPETAWHYSGGTVYFQHGVVSDVQRS